MKILAIHSRYRRLGGEDISFRAEVDLLGVLGHVVTEIQIDSNARALRPSSEQLRSLVSGDREFETAFRAALAEERPDLIYLNNWFPWIAPSIGEILEAAPVLVAVRNYRLWCINGLLFRSGKPCVECMEAGRWRGVVHSCYGSRPSSLLATRLSAHVRREIASHPQVHFAAASQFVAAFLEDAGIPSNRIHVKPNVVTPMPPVGSGGDQVLFVGRLEEPKGFDDFVWSCRVSGARMAVVGDGPLRSLVRDDEYLGQLPHDETLGVMGRSLVTVVPSLSHETFGRVAAESLGCGTPVIVSSSGALPEVGDASCSSVVQAGNRDMLAAAIRTAIDDPYWSTGARAAARKVFTTWYAPDVVAHELNAAVRAASGVPHDG